MTTSDVVVITGSQRASDGLPPSSSPGGVRGSPCSRTVTTASKLPSAKSKRPESAFTIPTDVADPDQVERAAERVERELASIDIWVNCAMVTVFSPVGSLAPEEFRRVTEVTTSARCMARWRRSSGCGRGAAT